MTIPAEQVASVMVAHAKTLVDKQVTFTVTSSRISCVEVAVMVAKYGSSRNGCHYAFTFVNEQVDK